MATRALDTTNLRGPCVSALRSRKWRRVPESLNLTLASVQMGGMLGRVCKSRTNFLGISVASECDMDSNGLHDLLVPA